MQECEVNVSVRATLGLRAVAIDLANRLHIELLASMAEHLNDAQYARYKSACDAELTETLSQIDSLSTKL